MTHTLTTHRADDIAAAIAAWDAVAATCPCGQAASHVDADPGSPEWACRVPLARPLPDVVEDRDGDRWRREVGTVDSFRLMLGERGEVRTLDELRSEFGPIHPAGTAL